jgi:hypothetical protein
MTNKKTYYQVILDKSGSMYDCIESTVTGFNEQIECICNLSKKFPGQEFAVSLTTFNGDIHDDIDRIHPAEIKKLTKKTWLKNNSKDFITYEPSGTTSLYDAIGLSVKKILNIAQEEIEANLASVVVVIITDGHENSSNIYNYHDIQSMIEELELTKKWSFNYLSNTPDAVNYAERLNIKKSNARFYNKRNMSEQWEGVSKSLCSYIYEKENDNIKEDFLEF